MRNDSDIMTEILNAMCSNKTLQKVGDTYEIPDDITNEDVKNVLLKRAEEYLNEELMEPYGKARLGRSAKEQQEVINEQISRFRDIIKEMCKKLYLSPPPDNEIESVLRDGLDPRYGTTC